MMMHNTDLVRAFASLSLSFLIWNPGRNNAQLARLVRILHVKGLQLLACDWPSVLLSLLASKQAKEREVRGYQAWGP